MNITNLNEELQKLQKDFQDINSLQGFNSSVRKYGVDIKPYEVFTSPVKEPISALFARILSLKIKTALDDKFRANWQHYWLSCCLNEKCDYVFSILGSKDFGIDREEDLLDIMKEGSLWKYSTHEGKRYYNSLALNFLLKRYNWIDSLSLYANSSFPNLSFVNLLFPRMLSAILIGFIAIITSTEIWNFASNNQATLIFYSLIMILVSFSYLSFECNEKTQMLLPKKKLLFRVSIIFAFGLLSSFVFCLSFTKISLLDPSSLSGNGYCLNTTFFYSTLAYFIGIIVQLLWEDKTVTEPL